MASDTVPAAVPGPTDPPASPAGTTEPGGLTGLLSAVDPARPAGFHITPTTDAPDAFGQADLGASSAAYQDLTDPQQAAAGKGGGTGNGKDTGVVRAFLLAGAERWRKGADARLKQLDIKKARAQAFKESRKVNENRTVNRAEKIVGGSTNSSTGSKADSGKPLSSKNTGNGGSAGSKNNSRNGSHTGSRSGSGGSGSQGGTGYRSGHGPGRGNGTSGDDRSRKGAGGGKGTHDSGSGSGKGKQPPAEKTSNTSGGSGRDSNGSGGSGKSSGSTSPSTSTASRNTPASRGSRTTTQTCGDSSGIDTKRSKKQNDADQKPTDGRTETTGKNTGAKDGKDTSTPADLTKKTEQPKPPNGGRGADGKAEGDPGKKDDTKPASPQAPAQDRGQRVDTRTSRETGYRDGSRAAQAAAHVGAYRDGVRDGWTDTRQAADRDKARLDKAHADRRKQREQTTTPAPAVPPKPLHPPTPPRPKDPPMPQPDTAAPQTATPIKVDNVGATHLRLGDGAARPYMSRGEVRSLKTFERRLQDRTQSMTKVAEASKVLHAQAVDQATKATRLMESAKAVKGGEKLAAALARLQEAAQIQALKAEETHRRALRAADNCKALLANVETRYGPLYQAVVDSPETEPAETHFYLGDHSG